MKLLKALEDRHEERWDTLFSGLTDDARASLCAYCVRRMLRNTEGVQDSIPLLSAIQQWYEEHHLTTEAAGSWERTGINPFDWRHE